MFGVKSARGRRGENGGNAARGALQRRLIVSMNRRRRGHAGEGCITREVYYPEVIYVVD